MTVTKDNTTQVSLESGTQMPKLVTFNRNDIGFPFEKLEVEPIPLGHGTTAQVQLADVPLENLRLDRSNPRISFKLQARNKANPSQDELTELLWEDDDVKRLKRSIASTGGLVEAIIVQGSDGTVLEGNCRTACYRKLAAEYPEDERWQKVRARILPPEIAREQINVLLGELHIAGKNQWQAFEQAHHLYEMAERGFTRDELAEMYRQSKSSVQAKIDAYNLMNEKYLPQAPGSVSLLDKWSYFEEFYKRCKPHKDEAGQELEDNFVRWMLADKFPRGEHVRMLPKVLRDEDAREALEGENILAAWKVVEDRSPELGSKLFKAIVAAKEALESAPLTEVNAVRDGDAARLKELKALRDALNSFIRQTGKKL